MKLTDLFLAELEREVLRTRHALEQVPDNQRSFKPHEKSMEFGYLADMVATMPMWIVMVVKQDELDIAPKTPGDSHRPPESRNSGEFIKALEDAAEKARAALTGTDDDFLSTRWKLLAGGNVVSDSPRHEVIRDTINHWAHHRGQMTVYLRLMGAKVPAIYGPSADDQSFG